MPIKRNAHIMPLSRDHHSGLLFGWKIKEGVKKEIAFSRINEYIGFFWKAHLRNHFQDEEHLLFCLLDNELIQKAKREHQELEAWFVKAENNELGSNDEYIRFVELLISHIRFEERELFPCLESELSPETLAHVGEALTKSHQQPYTELYEDEFWVDKENQKHL
ncbi:hemerythrin domain-containing protein [Mucilaginibacter sp.]|uniref:hemerythrin domain-containing protein n=1 Tax=Mucilaginibacter sp. TaxID=1882438 RepID=UPI0025E00F7F|nr:hemerythrin domain-containing protein [Mucilaginibacter sp.]